MLTIQIEKIDKCQKERNDINTLLLSLINDRDRINKYFNDKTDNI